MRVQYGSSLVRSVGFFDIYPSRTPAHHHLLSAVLYGETSTDVYPHGILYRNGPEHSNAPVWCVNLVSWPYFALLPYEQAEELSVSGNTFTVRFPASSGTLLYDPTLDLKLTPDDEDGFWRDPWFVWTTVSVGALVSNLVVVHR